MEKVEPLQPWKRLDSRQARFVDEYMRDGDAARAARAAGYGAAHAAGTGKRLVDHPDIAAEIDRRRARLAGAAERSQADLVRRLEAVAFGSFGRFIRVTEGGLAAVDLSDATPEELDIIAEISTEELASGRGEDSVAVLKSKFKLLDPLRAAEMLAKLHGWNAPEKHEHSGPGGAPIAIEDISRVSPADAMRAYLDMARGTEE